MPEPRLTQAQKQARRAQVKTALSKLTELLDWLKLRVARDRKWMRFYRRFNLFIGLPATVLAALAAASAFGELFGKVGTGVISLMVVLLSTVLASVEPAKRQQSRYEQFDKLSELAKDVDRYLSIDVSDASMRIHAPEFLVDAESRRYEAMHGQPLPERWMQGEPPAIPGGPDYPWLADADPD